MRPPRDARHPQPRSLHELAIETPLSRTLTSVNLRPEDKAVFDAMQAFFSYRRGRMLGGFRVAS